MAPAEEAAAGQGSYQLGFQLTPLTVGGGLDLSGDFKGGRHAAEEDTLFKMAEENRDGGNKMVQAGQYEAAIGRYSELIMQTRALDNEQDIDWTDAGRTAVRQLRAAAYLNLSLCFLKTQQWTHAVNTATRALQGDKDPADPKDDVLAPEKKAKALFRRAQAQREGFDNLTNAVEDLKKALTYAPEDKAIQQELAKVERALAKATKEADKKMAGFLNSNKKVQSGEGLFDDSLRPPENPKPAPKPTEPVKWTEGLWVMPGTDEPPPSAKKEKPEDEKVDYDELAREITELKEADPAEFEALKEQVQKEFVKQLQALEEEKGEGEENAAAVEQGQVRSDEGATSTAAAAVEPGQVQSEEAATSTAAAA